MHGTQPVPAAFATDRNPHFVHVPGDVSAALAPHDTQAVPAAFGTLPAPQATHLPPTFASSLPQVSRQHDVPTRVEPAGHAWQLPFSSTVPAGQPQDQPQHAETALSS